MSSALLAAGWRRTNSGRWIHPDAPAAEGTSGMRRRPFTEAEALTLLGAEDHDEDTQPSTTNPSEAHA